MSSAAPSVGTPQAARMMNRGGHLRQPAISCPCLKSSPYSTADHANIASKHLASSSWLKAISLAAEYSINAPLQSHKSQSRLNEAAKQLPTLAMYSCAPTELVLIESTSPQAAPRTRLVVIHPAQRAGASATAFKICDSASRRQSLRAAFRIRVREVRPK
jgi:hypothetical protein